MIGPSGHSGWRLTAPTGKTINYPRSWMITDTPAVTAVR